MRVRDIRGPVLCEDVRREGNGKHLLIGVVIGDLRLQSIPGVLVLTLYGEVDSVEVGPTALRYRVMIGHEVVTSGGFELEFRNSGPQALVLGPLVIKIGRSGRMRIQLDTDGDRWTTVRSFEIQRDPSVAGEPTPVDSTMFKQVESSQR